MAIIDIKQGATFQGATSYIGVPFMVLGIAGVVFALMNTWLMLLPALLLFAIGLIIFMVRKGTRIDPERRRFQPYRDLLLFKIGPWVPLDGITTVRVKRERETYSHDPAGAGIMQNRTRFWCFNVTLHGQGLVKLLFLKEFNEPAPALALSHRLSEVLGIDLEDLTAAPQVRSRTRR